MDKIKQMIALLRPPYRPEPLPAEEIASIRVRFPHLPEEYFALLQAIGYGDNGALTLYREPLSPEETFIDFSVDPGLLFFGDYDSDLYFAFSSSNPRLVVTRCRDTTDGHIGGEIDFMDFMLRRFQGENCF